MKSSQRVNPECLLAVIHTLNWYGVIPVLVILKVSCCLLGYKRDEYCVAFRRDRLNEFRKSSCFD